MFDKKGPNHAYAGIYGRAFVFPNAPLVFRSHARRGPCTGPVEPALPRSLECLPVGIAAGLICGPICGVLANLFCNEGKAY